ncbi:hypothetical protein [Fulvivirga lutea]|uniref:Uncharacterized protein n=1 Tax=Fulvivirga lutea TaxID=2810512 RepID=A0A975A0K5_9BACT|nr:hypothetical protein [Fulvivirga lutea]QSE96537.1 hypothetical protein JR347_13125 [Fulvivirga lutea]
MNWSDSDTVGIPYLSDERFNYELIYTFEKRPQPPQDQFDEDLNRSTYSPSPLPYVKIKLFLMLQESEGIFRYRVENNKGDILRNRKVKDLTEDFIIDMGFADDIKDRTGAHEFLIFLLDDDKKEVAKLIFFFSEKGNLFINGQERGKI